MEGRSRVARPARTTVSYQRRPLLARDGLAQVAQANLQANGQAVGIERARPYDLRHAFASLLIHEGRLSVVDIAAQLGHNPTVCLDTYAHVMAEQRGAERVGAADQIMLAREQARGGEQTAGIGVQLSLDDLPESDDVR